METWRLLDILRSNDFEVEPLAQGARTRVSANGRLVAVIHHLGDQEHITVRRGGIDRALFTAEVNIPLSLLDDRVSTGDQPWSGRYVAFAAAGVEAFTPILILCNPHMPKPPHP